MKALLPLLALMVALAACGEAGDLIVTDDDAGTTFEVHRDEAFEVRLPSNPTTGFSWAPVPVDGVSIGAPEFVGGASDLVGAPGYELFEVTPLTNGPTHLTFEYARPWEQVPPEQTFEIDLIVVD